MRRGAVVRCSTIFVAIAIPSSARAGAKLTSGDRELDLGAILQVHTIAGNHDWDQDRRVDDVPRFLVRRARLRLGAKIGKISAFLQTDRGDGDGRLGLEYRLIDAWARARIDPWLQVQAGIHLAPSTRQNVTLSVALLTLDRPAIAFKSLTWGTRSLGAFATRASAESDAGLRPRTPVRDLGWTVFGGGPIGSRTFVKYYLGIYEGVIASDVRAPRITGRVQVNFLEPEPEYFVSATYLGKKKTIAIGASYDTQPSVARDALLGLVRYELATVDLFLEHPIGGFVATAEAGLQTLGLGGATALDADRNPDTAPRDARRSEGSGGYVQAAIMRGAFQPWIGGEWWNARTQIGDHRAARAGVTWYLDGHSTKLTLGYEHFVAKAPLDPAGTRRWNTVALALFFWF
jgi:hypothetical protein